MIWGKEDPARRIFSAIISRGNGKKIVVNLAIELSSSKYSFQPNGMSRQAMERGKIVGESKFPGKFRITWNINGSKLVPVEKHFLQSEPGTN